MTVSELHPEIARPFGSEELSFSAACDCSDVFRRGFHALGRRACDGRLYAGEYGEAQ